MGFPMSFVSLVVSVMLGVSGLALPSSEHVVPARGVVKARSYIDNEHHNLWVGNSSGVVPALSARAGVVDPVIKGQLDSVFRASAGSKKFFWTGRMLPATSDADSVMNPAGDLARRNGGSTLEETIKNIKMPTFEQRDENSIATWEYASEQFASYAKGEAFLVHGDTTRNNNVWDTFEFPRLKAGGKIKRIWRYDMTTGERIKGNKYQIYPACADLGDKTPRCTGGAPLYYGSAKKPVVGANTVIARDGTAQVSASGSATNIVPACNQLLDPMWVKQMMMEAGSCTAGTAITSKIKTLLAGKGNRQYVQKARILAIVKSLTDGVPNVSRFKNSPLDALVAIDYYQKTAASAASVASQIEQALKSATGSSPALAAEYKKKMDALIPIKATLLALVKKQMAQKAKQAKATADRAASCARPAKLELVAAGAKSMHRRSPGTMSPVPVSSLQASRSGGNRVGPRAAPAPSCPAKKAPTKKVIPRSKAPMKPPRAQRPRQPTKRPATRPARPTKKKVPRPATRPRRQPGKPKQTRRTTPKRKPRKVPKPPRRPKGKPRTRRRR